MAVRRTWAVARTMIAEAIRMKIALVLLIVLVAVIPIGPFIWEGDGTLKGRVQTFLTYSHMLVLVMLSIMTVFVACQSLSKEVTERQIYTIASKPIPRWQFILGKWLGLCLLNAMLLGICGLAIYLFTMYMSGLQADPWDKAALRWEVLVARKGVRLPMPDFTDVVEQRFEAFKKTDRYREVEMTSRLADSIKSSYYSEARHRWRSVPPGDLKTWVFEGIHPDPGCEYIHLRYKMRGSPAPAGMQVKCVWLIGDPTKPGCIPIPRSDSIDQWHYFPIKSDVVEKDGTLRVTFVNRHAAYLYTVTTAPTNKSTVTFQEPNGLEVLYEVSSFESNFVRSMLLIFVWLVPLAALGLFAGSFLSFSVGALLCSSVLVTSALSDFVYTAIYYIREAPNPHQDPLDYFSWIFKPFIMLIINAVPSLDKYNPIDLLADGRAITWGSLGEAFAVMVLIQSVIYLVLAVLIFWKRELAQVTV